MALPTCCTEFEPSAWQAALIVIMAFADGLALNSLAPCAATTIYSRRCKLPYFTVLGWEIVQIYTGFAVSLFGVFGSLYICCHIRFTFWQPCWDKKILSDGADSVYDFFLNILAHFLSFHGQANVRERPKTHIWHLLERLISVFWISWYVWLKQYSVVELMRTASSLS